MVYHNKTKYGVDVADQMARQYSVKCASRRWPLHVFFNIIDLAIINSWILYKKIARSNISCRQFMQQLTEELSGTCKNRRNRRDESVPPPPKKRRQCFGPCNIDHTTNECSKCSRPVCGKCCSIVKTCICIECHNKKEIDLASTGYYEEIHNRLKSRADVHNNILEDDKVTVKELGGWECAKCHY